jgi:hypothetical protein
VAERIVTDLPDYERPPVVEIAAAVQFAPLAHFGMREALAVARSFEGWELLDVAPALDPILEAPLGQLVAPSVRIAIGIPPPRVLLGTEAGRWLTQLQQDRLVAHERKAGVRPSFVNVAPRVREVARHAGNGLDVPLLREPHAPELVELIYENLIPRGEGWSDPGEMHRVLRVFGEEAGAPPFASFEQAQISFSYELLEGGEFNGRLHVLAQPQLGPDGGGALHLRLISRRTVGDQEFDRVLEQCHADIVHAFTAVTTERMHEIWGRIR